MTKKQTVQGLSKHLAINSFQNMTWNDKSSPQFLILPTFISIGNTNIYDRNMILTQ